VRLLTRPAHAAAEIFARACYEGTELSLAIGVEHLVLACAILSPALEEYGVTPEDIRERIRADERDALASLGISLESVRGELEERFGGEVWSHAHCVGVSPEAKRMLELATRRRRRVTPEQMLATLIRHSASARRLLFELDVPVGTLAERLTR
jgi:Clp amino terminal domain, pathogenicity island component